MPGRVRDSVAPLLVDRPLGEHVTQVQRRDGVAPAIEEEAPGALLIKLEAADERLRDVCIEHVIGSATLPIAPIRTRDAGPIDGSGTSTTSSARSSESTKILTRDLE